MLRVGLLAPALLAPAPALGVASPPERRYSAFHPGQPWADTSGATIDAHGAVLPKGSRATPRGAATTIEIGAPLASRPWLGVGYDVLGDTRTFLRSGLRTLLR